jgi:hypothetical protein
MNVPNRSALPKSDVVPTERGASEAIVTKFLRAALAVDAVGVPELDEKAQAKGLLGERQSITTAKVFKRAKKSLGIRSRRTGFGARSQWLWQLPRQSDPVPIKTEAAQERRGAIPIDWVQGVAYLDPDRPPNDVPRHRWRQFVDDCKNFLSSSEHWADRAAQLGWDATALFGCAPKRPLDYLGSAGLLWAIKGGRLLELHRDWAVIDVPVHGSQRIFYRRNVKAAKITLPWATQTSSRQLAALARQGSRKAGDPPEPIGVPRRRVCPAIGPPWGSGSP